MPTPVRVLILEDEPNDVELMLRELRRVNFEPDWECVENEADYLACLDKAFDVILADYTLPQFNAMQALQLLQSRGLDIPFIIVTGTLSEEAAVSCMKQGADDYLLKDRLVRLGAAITHALHRKQLREEKRQAEAAVRESEARFRRLAENAQDIIYRYRLAPEPGFEYISPAVTTITGYTPEEYYTDPNLGVKIVHPDDQDTLRRMSEGISALPQPIILRWRHKDGRLIWTEHRNTPIYDENGALVALEGIARDVTASVAAEKNLKRSLEEKEVLLREVHHRVKNNLQAISNLLYMQASHIKDQQTRHIFREMQDRIRSIALIHQKLYQTDNVARVDFEEYVRSLATHLIRSSEINSDLVLVNLEVENGLLDLNTAVPMGIIVNELISNALKHAFPPGWEHPTGGKGELYIGLRPEETGQQVLTVTDNGVGFPPDFDLDRVESLGLQLVQMLANHMKGELVVKQDGGTVDTITFASLDVPEGERESFC